MNFYFLFFIFVLIQSCSSSSVIQLTSQNYDEMTKSYGVLFINFYADWCKFSQMLTPIFEETYEKVLAKFSEPNAVAFAKVDCEDQSDLASRFHISKYPTLKLVLHGNIYKKEYRGSRNKEAMLKFIETTLSDPVVHVTSISEYEKIDEQKAAIVSFIPHVPGTSSDYDIYRKVAMDLRDDCNFYWVTGDPLQSVAVSRNIVNKIVFKSPRTKIDEIESEYPGGLQSYSELSTWTTNKCIPLVREITFENAEELTEEGLPFMILFYHPDNKSSIDLYRKVVHEELFTESSSINFLIADGKKFAHPLHHLGKTVNDLPLIAIDSFRHMYIFSSYEDITIQGKLKTFIDDLHSGKLHREFHFGPDKPEHTHEAVVTSPPESTFKKLAPNSNRYSILKDEL